MGIAKVEDFPFPTCPSKEAIKIHENLLVAIGALEIREVIDKQS